MPEPEFNRRQFGKRAARTSALGSLALLGSQSESTAESSESVPPAIAEPIPPHPIPVDLLLLEVIRQKYPDRKLTHHILREIRRDLRSELRRAKAIRSVPLQNANAPAALFAAYRAEESERVEE